ncbi:MAG: hypothetical protein P9M03_10165 [Candidatus Theseobacter exili]|nr:hypothetical protein [Candidatus Theseobacter exili]
MTPKERVEAVLLSHKADHVPFTVYENMIPQCECERELRNEGLCIVNRVSVFKTETPDVKTHTLHYVDEKDGVSKNKTIYETPCGNLSAIRIPAGFTTWREELLFKCFDDYKAIEFMIKNRRHTANYEQVIRQMKIAGDDIIFRAGIGYEPMQEIMHNIMGIETFSLEWMDNRDEIMKLYDVLVEDRRKIYPIVAESPLLHANYGGNVTPEIIGLERFKEYYVPHYNECAEIMHKHGKLLGTHLDANTKLIADAVGETELDYIEAFTPPPDCDLSVKEALRIWPEKKIWINFPSSVHLSNIEVIKDTMRKILKESGNGTRLIVGITEDVPEDRWQENFSTIVRVLNTDGKLPLFDKEPVVF